MGRMSAAILVMTAALTVFAGEGEASLINTPVPDITLQDQYGKTISLRQFGGRVLVLIASDKEGGKQNGAWKKALIHTYRDGISLAGVADVRTVPFFLKGTIKAGFKKEEGSVLMDWKAEVFKALGLRSGISNIVVIDQQGVLRYMTSGEGTGESIAALFAEIDRLK